MWDDMRYYSEDTLIMVDVNFVIVFFCLINNFYYRVVLNDSFIVDVFTILVLGTDFSNLDFILFFVDEEEVMVYLMADFGSYSFDFYSYFWEMETKRNNFDLLVWVFAVRKIDEDSTEVHGTIYGIIVVEVTKVNGMISSASVTDDLKRSLQTFINLDFDRMIIVVFI